jgi:hypothetical protein
MNLDRTTYELFIIDYLEGHLDAVQVSELLLFLEQNPDLKTEFEGIEQVYLHQEEILGIDKKTLKKPEQINITPAIENLMVAVLESDATPAEQTHLTELVATYPNLSKEYHWFTQTKVEPDLALVFPQKRTLKKYRIGLWYKISAVAAVFIACLIIAALYIKPTSTNIEASLKLAPKSTVQVKAKTIEPQAASLAHTQKTKHQLVQGSKHSTLIKSAPITCSLVATNQTPILTMASKLELKTENRQVIVLAASKANTDDFINANEWIKNKVTETTSPNSLLARFNQITGAGIIFEKDSFSGKFKRFEITSLGLALNK